MIWIETEDGDLVNLDKVDHIYHGQVEHGWRTTALVCGNGVWLSAHETPSGARRAVLRISRAIRNLNPIEGKSHVIRMANLKSE